MAVTVASAAGSETLLVGLDARVGLEVVARDGSAEEAMGRGAAVGRGGTRDGGGTVAMLSNA